MIPPPIRLRVEHDGQNRFLLPEGAELTKESQVTLDGERFFTPSSWRVESGIFIWCDSMYTLRRTSNLLVAL
jgi:hypothetical protein